MPKGATRLALHSTAGTLAAHKRSPHLLHDFEMSLSASSEIHDHMNFHDTGKPLTSR